MENQTPVVPVVTPQVVVEQPLPAQAGKQSSFLTILLSVLLLLAVLIAGFFAFQTQQLVKELTMLREETMPIANVEPTAEPVATESSEVDPTANWKSYSDKEYSFKLPINWDTYLGISEGKSNQIFIAPSERIAQLKKLWESGSGFGGGSFLNMSIQMDNSIKNYTPKNDEYQNVAVKNIVVSGINSKLYTTEVLQSSPMGEVGDKLYSVHIPYMNNNYNIQLFDGQYKTEFDQILSTFKFTN